MMKRRLAARRELFTDPLAWGDVARGARLVSVPRNTSQYISARLLHLLLANYFTCL